MKSYLILISLVVFGVSPVLADQAGKRDKILYYFEANGVLDSVDSQIEAMLEQSRHQYANFPDSLWTDGRLDKLFKQYRADLIEAYVDAADETFSDEDVDWLVAFMDTEQGRKMLELTQRVRPNYDNAAKSVYGPFMEKFTALILEYAQQ